MKTKRMVPVVYGVMAMVAVLMLLPSALRPPPDEANASAEFSPDAPPDEDPDVIIQTLEQARSQTAGGLRTENEFEEVALTTTTRPPPPVVVQTKSQCFGDPPRQTESEYSAPCKAIFRGDNGGDTYAGVTADEIRIGFAACGHNLTQARQGPEPSEKPEGGQSAVAWAYQKYFNDHYEGYNRYITFIGAQPDCTDETTQQADIIAADEQYDFFAVVADSPPVARAMANRGKVVFFSFEQSQDLYDELAPYLWSFNPTGEELAAHTAEHLCKRVLGRPAEFAGDPLLQGEQRKFGLIIQPLSAGPAGWPTIEQKVRDRCREEIIVFVGSPYDPNFLGQAMSQFRLEGVTTVGIRSDVVAPSVILKAASGQNYRPEWYITPTHDLDHPIQPKLFGYDKEQWANAFGLGQREPNRPSVDYDWGKAYRYSYPEATTAPSIGGPMYNTVAQLINGIHMAGPNLNPKTFEDALTTLAPRFWTNGEVGGGFSPGDHTYLQDLLEIYWDNEARDYHDAIPGYTDTPGSYVHVHCGKRYTAGSYPTAELEVFDDRYRCETFG